ncbi:class A beta-lactamase [Phenylobacterium soli]|nr:class A beta-lactamase [Phenylobacterium soli]
MRRPRRSRAPKAAAIAGLAALAGVIGVGGWAAHDRQAGPEHAELTSTPKITKVSLPAPPAPPALQEKIEQLAERYREPVGIAITDVSARWTAQVAGDEVFPQQSVSKLWVALAVMHAVDRGQLRLDQPVTLTKEDRSVFYQPITAKIRGPNGYATSVYELLKYQLTESDNAANDKLIAEVGGGEAVSRVMAEKGLEGLGRGETERDLQTRAAGLTWKPEYGLTWVWKAAREELPETVRDQALEAYLANPGDGAKPAAITNALAALHRGELLSPQSTEAMLDLMAQCRTGSSRLRAGLPSGWSIAHKTGTGPDWRGASVGINDVGLITAPDGRTYAVAVMLRQTRHPVGARQALMQAVARAVVDYWRTTPKGLSVPDRRVASLGSAPETAR